MNRFIVFLLCVLVLSGIKNQARSQNNSKTYHDMNKSVTQILERIRNHEFHPIDQEQSLTIDKNLGTAGIADLDNDDWEVRILAIRDLILAEHDEFEKIVNGLKDSSFHVRQICAKALGIIANKEAISPLEQVAQNDKNAIVRSQAIMSLGQMGANQSLALLKEILEKDPSRDVRHQCELAIDQIEKKQGRTEKLKKAFLSIDEKEFKTLKINTLGPDFVLEDTEGNEWQLSNYRNKKWIILIWVFADWCPVCHGEFHDLMKMKSAFESENIQVFTIETHDSYRGRVMVGKELEPDYWFSKKSFKEAYTNNIWWPHLLDRGGLIAAKFGADPFAFSVHAEYINRPATVIIDKEGKVRFKYIGTYWGDRPSIEKTLEMIQNEDFSFEHPKRLIIHGIDN